MAALSITTRILMERKTYCMGCDKIGFITDEGMIGPNGWITCEVCRGVYYCTQRCKQLNARRRHARLCADFAQNRINLERLGEITKELEQSYPFRLSFGVLFTIIDAKEFIALYDEHGINLPNHNCYHIELSDSYANFCQRYEYLYKTNEVIRSQPASSPKVVNVVNEGFENENGCTFVVVHKENFSYFGVIYYNDRSA